MKQEENMKHFDSVSFSKQEASDAVEVEAEDFGAAAEKWAENWDIRNDRELSDTDPLVIHIRQNRKGSKERKMQVTANCYYRYNAYSLD